MEDAYGVAAAAHAGHDAVRQAPLLLQDLGAGLPPMTAWKSRTIMG